MTSSALPTDIVDRVAREFPGQKTDVALALLGRISGRERERIIRCVLHLSNGSIDRLRECVATAEKDFRDIIFFAEYDEDDNRIYDFTQPFEQSGGA
jgi:hypothetical protein